MGRWPGDLLRAIAAEALGRTITKKERPAQSVAVNLLKVTGYTEGLTASRCHLAMVVSLGGAIGIDPKHTVGRPGCQVGDLLTVLACKMGEHTDHERIG